MNSCVIRIAAFILLGTISNCSSKQDVFGGYVITVATLSARDSGQVIDLLPCFYYDKMVFNKRYIAIFPSKTRKSNTCEYTYDDSSISISNCSGQFLEGEYEYRFDEEILYLSTERLQIEAKPVVFNEVGTISFDLLNRVHDTTFVPPSYCDLLVSSL